MQAEHAQLSLHVFDIELLLDLLRKPAYKAQQVFEKLVAGNMVTGVQVYLRLQQHLIALCLPPAPTQAHHTTRWLGTYLRLIGQPCTKLQHQLLSASC